MPRPITLAPSPVSMARKVIDPIAFTKKFWPHVTLYREQKEILYSVRDNFETMCVAGNMLGKDFVTGLAILYFFLSRHPVRIVTTSVDASQLEGVLWGEIRRFIQTSVIPLDATQGGPILVNHMKLRKVIDGDVDALSYAIGRVAEKGEGMLGHHIATTEDGIPRTLFCCDEASGVDDATYEAAEKWMKRSLVIGNPFPCENFFRRGVKEGSKESPVPGEGLLRKVIKIRGEDSPNVRYARAEEAAGRQPSNRILVEGVLPYRDYVIRRATWDKVQQCIGLDAEFYEGAEVLLYPPLWLNYAETVAEIVAALVAAGKLKRTAEAMGIDPAEGGDSTSWVIVDKYGVLEWITKKTPDTTVIPNETIALIKRYGLKPENVLLDRGGGGKQAADTIRERGYQVRTVSFGEPASDVDALKRQRTRTEREEAGEEPKTYKNRRVEMYDLLSQAFDPAAYPRPVAGQPIEMKKVDGVYVPIGFGLPASMGEIRRQLAPIPRQYDEEGKQVLPPKQKRDKNDKRTTLTEMIGRSPDDADALALANFARVRKPTRFVIGAAF
jgi:hypothetical protein